MYSLLPEARCFRNAKIKKEEIMRSRFEVWRYSDSWNKWVRDIYRDPEEAQQRYEFLLRRGKKAKAPRPFNLSMKLAFAILSPGN